MHTPNSEYCVSMVNNVPLKSPVQLSLWRDDWDENVEPRSKLKASFFMVRGKTQGHKVEYVRSSHTVKLVSSETVSTEICQGRYSLQWVMPPHDFYLNKMS
ncbi:UNVERIFIED_CONTAM: hypothetical protein K2H54_053003 [Gekko kuhli]